MKPACLLLMFCFVTQARAAALTSKWKDIQSMFVDSPRASRTFARFHQAMSDPQHRLVFLSGGAETDKTFIMYLYMENFRAQTEFVTGLFPAFQSLAEESRLSGRIVQNAVAVDRKLWLANSEKGKGTLLAISTGPMRATHTAKFTSLLDYLAGLYPNMQEFNFLHPRTPVRIVLESRMRPRFLIENLTARGIAIKTVEFFGTCDWDLQAID